MIGRWQVGSRKLNYHLWIGYRQLRSLRITDSISGAQDAVQKCLTAPRFSTGLFVPSHNRTQQELPINIGDSTFATLKQEFKATTPPHFIGSCISGSTPTKDVRTLPPADVLQSLTHPTQVYVFSKTLAHRAVTDWIAEHPNLHFNVVRVLPGYIQGANELSTSPEQILASSAEGTLNMALGNVSATEPKLLDQVHLDDAARAHMAALDRKTVASSSLLLPVGNGGSGWSWDDFVPVMERLFPDEVKTGILKPRKGQADLAMQFDVSETYSVLEWEFAGLEEMVCDVVGQYLRLWEAGGGR